MIISIDGQQLAETGIGGENLEEILVELNERHLPPNRIIGDVLLNGKSYSEDVPHAAIEVSRGSIDSLELVTRSSEEIARHFLDHGSTIVSDLLNSVPRITEIFRMGDEEEANEHFLRFLEALQLLMEMLNGATITLGLNLAGSDGMDGNLEKISQILTRIINIQEQSDWIYLADLLEYELAPELEAFQTLLPRLTARVN